eukprot:403368018
MQQNSNPFISSASQAANPFNQSKPSSTNVFGQSNNSNNYGNSTTQLTIHQSFGLQQPQAIPGNQLFSSNKSFSYSGSNSVGMNSISQPAQQQNFNKLFSQSNILSGNVSTNSFSTAQFGGNTQSMFNTSAQTQGGFPSAQNNNNSLFPRGNGSSLVSQSSNIQTVNSVSNSSSQVSSPFAQLNSQSQQQKQVPQQQIGGMFSSNNTIQTQQTSGSGFNPFNMNKSTPFSQTQSQGFFNSQPTNQLSQINSNPIAQQYTNTAQNSQTNNIFQNSFQNQQQQQQQQNLSQTQNFSFGTKTPSIFAQQIQQQKVDQGLQNTSTLPTSTSLGANNSASFQFIQAQQPSVGQQNQSFNGSQSYFGMRSLANTSYQQTQNVTFQHQNNSPLLSLNKQTQNSLFYKPLKQITDPQEKLGIQQVRQRISKQTKTRREVEKIMNEEIQRELQELVSNIQSCQEQIDCMSQKQINANKEIRQIRLRFDDCQKFSQTCKIGLNDKISGRLREDKTPYEFFKMLRSAQNQRLQSLTQLIEQINNSMNSKSKNSLLNSTSTESSTQKIHQVLKLLYIQQQNIASQAFELDIRTKKCSIQFKEKFAEKLLSYNTIEKAEKTRIISVLLEDQNNIKVNEYDLNSAIKLIQNKRVSEELSNLFGTNLQVSDSFGFNKQLDKFQTPTSQVNSFVLDLLESSASQHFKELQDNQNSSFAQKLFNTKKRHTYLQSLMQNQSPYDLSHNSSTSNYRDKLKTSQSFNFHNEIIPKRLDFENIPVQQNNQTMNSRVFSNTKRFAPSRSYRNHQGQQRQILFETKISKYRYI